MTQIEKVLEWSQRLQKSCFGSPVSLTIEASKGLDNNKVIFVTVTAEEKQEHYVISSDMISAEIYQGWGKLKDDVSKLLDKYIGHKINKHGKIKEQ